MTSKIVSGLADSIGRLFTPLRRYLPSHLYLEDFPQYLIDVRGVLSYANQYENFVGPKAKHTLDDVCTSILTGKDQFRAWERGQTTYIENPILTKIHRNLDMIDATTIESQPIPTPRPRGVWLGWGYFVTVNGLYSKPKTARYLEAEVFIAYLGDVQRLFKHLEEKGELMIGQQAKNILNNIYNLLESASKQFNQWQQTETSNRDVRIPLDEKDFATLRALIK